MELQFNFMQSFSSRHTIYEFRNWLHEHGMTITLMTEEEPKKKFFVGQRVLCCGEICQIVPSGNANLPNTDDAMWVHVPSKRFASRYALHNIEPLPNGQL